MVEWGGDWSSPDAPAWPPAASAANYPEGFIASGSTGQRWQVRNKQWVRLVPLTTIDQSSIVGNPSGG